jgi:prepilin-type N-terminal cleavage/methylation domain-containing protein
METERKQTAGFTIVELLIALGLFAVVASIGIGGFVHALRVQREVQFILAANSNAGLALEQMAREIRTGSGFKLPQGLLLGGDFASSTVLEFTNADGALVNYSLRDGAVYRSVASWAPSPITSNNVNISHLSFDARGIIYEGYPPRVTISLIASPSSTDPALAGVATRLQTTVSARQADDRPPQLTVYKFVRGGPDPPQPSQFLLWVRAVHVRPCNTSLPKGVSAPTFPPGDPNAPFTSDVCYFTGSDAGVTMNFAPGTSTVGEVNPSPDYSITTSPPSNCTKKAAWGDVLSCTVNNTYHP